MQTILCIVAEDIEEINVIKMKLSAEKAFCALDDIKSLLRGKLKWPEDIVFTDDKILNDKVNEKYLENLEKLDDEIREIIDDRGINDVLCDN